MTKRIEALWEKYDTIVIPANAPAIQRTETRRGFYAGAAALFDILTNEAASLSDEEGEHILTNVMVELQQFSEDLRKGLV